MSLTADSISIELCGKQYEFKEPVRRVSRAMVKDIIAVQKRYGIADWKELDPINGLDACDACLDLLYSWHPGMNADKATLDNATEKEIAAAFIAVVGFIMRPFAQNQETSEA